MKKDNMKTAMSGLLVALLAAAVPALAADPGQRERGVNHRQAASTQAQTGSTQAQTGMRNSGGRQAGSTQAQAGTRNSGGRQAGSTQAQAGTRNFGGRQTVLAQAQTQTGTTQTQTATRESGINQRQQNQQQRIQQGSRQGDLTRGETRQLQSQARDIRREERTFRSDGSFTPGERQNVQRDLDRLSRDIQRERHDGDRRGFGQDGRFQNGNGYAYGRQDNWRDGRFQNGNGYAYGRQGHASTRQFDRRVDRIEHNQRERIERGIRSGELTRHEAQRLMTEQRRIESEERRYMADGVLTQWERRDLTRDLNAAGQHIYNETHDDQTRR